MWGESVAIERVVSRLILSQMGFFFKLPNYETPFATHSRCIQVILHNPAKNYLNIIGTPTHFSHINWEWNKVGDGVIGAGHESFKHTRPPRFSSYSGRSSSSQAPWCSERTGMLRFCYEYVLLRTNSENGVWGKKINKSKHLIQVLRLTGCLKHMLSVLC